MDKGERIYIAGHNGLVGASIERKLRALGYENIITRSHAELDLLRQDQVEHFFATERPDCVFLAAAKVGGIAANMAAPAQFLYENIMIESNIIHAAYQSNVKRLLFLGSSCIYPRLSPQPMKEEYLLDGKVEPTNEGYAIAKIAGLKLCEMYNRQYGAAFVSVMPSNVYGVGDCYDLERAHVVGALIHRFHAAKKSGAEKIVLWGTGNARRELLYVDDLADACLFLMEQEYQGAFLNIGTGFDVSIRELAEIVKWVVGFDGAIAFDDTKPDGMPQKLLDVSKMSALGWSYKTGLEEGIRLTYADFLNKNLA